MSINTLFTTNPLHLSPFVQNQDSTSTIIEQVLSPEKLPPTSSHFNSFPNPKQTIITEAPPSFDAQPSKPLQEVDSNPYQNPIGLIIFFGLIISFLAYKYLHNLLLKNAAKKRKRPSNTTDYFPTFNVEPTNKKEVLPQQIVVDLPHTSSIERLEKLYEEGVSFVQEELYVLACDNFENIIQYKEVKKARALVIAATIAAMNVYLQKANNYKKEGNVDRCIHQLKKGLMIAEKSLEDASIQQLSRQMLHQLIHHVQTAYYQKGLEFEQKYSYPKAAQFYDSAIQLVGNIAHPSLTDLVNELNIRKTISEIKAGQGMPPQILDSLKGSKFDSELRYVYANYLASIGQVTKAENIIQQLVHVDYQEASIAEKNGNYEQALHHYKSLVSYFGNDKLLNGPLATDKITAKARLYITQLKAGKMPNIAAIEKISIELKSTKNPTELDLLNDLNYRLAIYFLQEGLLQKAKKTLTHLPKHSPYTQQLASICEQYAPKSKALISDKNTAKNLTIAIAMLDVDSFDSL